MRQGVGREVHFTKKTAIAILLLIAVLTSVWFLGGTAYAEEEGEQEKLLPVEGVTADVIPEDQAVTIRWTKPSEAYQEYTVVIERSNDPKKGFAKIDTREISMYSPEEMYTDYIEKGIPYYYRVKVTSYAEYIEEPYWDELTGEYIDRTTHTGESEYIYTEKVMLTLEAPQLSKVEAGQDHTIAIYWDNINEYQYDGYRIYQRVGKTGDFQLLKNIKAGTYPDKSYSHDHRFNVKNLKLGTTYYYKITAYRQVGSQKYENTFSKVRSATVTINKTEIVKAVSKAKRTNTIKWQKNKEADGYIVYFAKKLNGKYRKLKTIRNRNTTTYTHKKLTNGKAYYYKVVSYKKTKNGTLTSKSEPYEKYCDYYGHAEETLSDKTLRIFGKGVVYDYFSDEYLPGYKTQASAAKHMTTLRIKVWDLDSKGKKYTRYFWLTVNKKIAPTVEQMFKEIYASGEKIPIHSIGAFRYVGGQHMYGLAIDINPTENALIDHGKVLAGSFWDPKKSPYSIPQNSKMVRIMKKYGFLRGEWGDRHDYMHFSYFGY